MSETIIAYHNLVKRNSTTIISWSFYPITPVFLAFLINLLYTYIYFTTYFFIVCMYTIINVSFEPISCTFLINNPLVYSQMGLMYVFNLIVGTGALTMPSPIYDAGWLLSLIILVILAFMRYKFPLLFFFTNFFFYLTYTITIV